MRPPRPTDKIRRHHSAIHKRLHEIVERIDALDGRPPQETRRQLDDDARFLLDDLLHHANSEDRHLYPALEALLKEYVSATAFMSLEHVMIGSELKGLAEEMTKAGTSEMPSPEQLAALRRRAHRLMAILQMHTANEEEIMLPLADEHLKAEQIDDIVRRMHED
jgi:iron-sulfur cluster repair protein YtfE (RIC family)